MSLNRLQFVLSIAAIVLASGVAAAANKPEPHNTSRFQGPKANTGVAIHTTESGKSMLRVSKDFTVPDTPAPTWRVVDSKGNVHTLNAFKIKVARSVRLSCPAMSTTSPKCRFTARGPRCCLGKRTSPRLSSKSDHPISSHRGAPSRAAPALFVNPLPPAPTWFIDEHQFLPSASSNSSRPGIQPGTCVISPADGQAAEHGA